MRKIILLLVIPVLSFGQVPNPDSLDRSNDMQVFDLYYDIDIIESTPLFPGCQKSTAADYNLRKQEDLQCFNSGIINHIKENFKYPAVAKEMGIFEKIFVRFTIDKAGNITDVKIVHGYNKDLQEEALRLINGLPKMTPASEKGKPVSVHYTVPINFLLK